MNKHDYNYYIRKGDEYLDLAVKSDYHNSSTRYIALSNTFYRRAELERMKK